MKFAISPRQRRMFFGELRRTVSALGIADESERNFYYNGLLAKHGLESLDGLASNRAFDALISDLRSDRGDFRGAVDCAAGDVTRMTFCVKVAAAQICQIAGIGEGAAREYVEGVIRQSRMGFGFRVNSGSFLLDMPTVQLSRLMRILCTHLARLKRKEFPRAKVALDPTVRFSINGPIKVCEGVERGYYDSLPFALTISAA